MMTNYHASYYAHELSRVGGTGVDRLGRALFDACVDLNPHQIEAALFALRSPLSKGVLLADEVGLGKTIEAGLVLCQYWAERRRNILVISPASLRKQWALELSEKFNLPSIVLDAKTYKDQQKLGIPNPFRDKQIIICSMHFAASRAEELKEIAWDLVVIDEAHKLRNAYRESNRLGQRIRWATEDRKKLLLTATPLQNSLLELYGLSTLIDDRLFGDLASFRTQYINYGGDISGLRERLGTFCWRSLRSQVIEFVRYTERKLITRPFKPTEQEHKLYEAVSSYLMRDETYALPSGQKHLLILLVRKVLASSPHAVAGTLEIMRDRLLKLSDEARQNASALDLLISGEDIDDDLLDEILEDEEDGLIDDESPTPEIEPEPQAKKIDLEKLNAEIEELTDYIRWARSLGIDTKTRALLKALDIGFSVMEDMGAAKKVVVFTESRRTQNWLKDFLDYDTLFFELERFKRERSWYNFNITKDGIQRLLGDPNWYTLYLPETRLNPATFDGVLLLQQVASELLKRYCDHYYNYRKREYIEPRLELRDLTPDDDNIPQEEFYQLIVDGDEEQVIQGIQQIKKDLAQKKDDLLKIGDLNEIGRAHV